MKDYSIIKNIDDLLQIVTDPENQPHQFMNDAKGLKEMFMVGDCNCEEPPSLSKDDIQIIICGGCNKIISNNKTE